LAFTNARNLILNAYVRVKRMSIDRLYAVLAA